MKFYQKLLLLFLLATLNSCISKKEIVYLQGQQTESENTVNYDPLIQNDDILSINILSSEPKLAAPFNLDSQFESSTNYGNNLHRTTYLVDTKGEIDFPILGKLKVAGLTKTKLKEDIKNRLSIYIIDPVINIRILNYKVSILGEVNKPGSYTITGDRVTILELLAMSGDLTMFGKRENILIIRDYLGKKTYNRVDLTKADFVNSPFYYLDQNDIVYIEPRKSKIDSNGIGSNVTTIISILGFVLTTTLILTR